MAPVKHGEGKRKGFWGTMTATFPAPKPGGLTWKIENWMSSSHIAIVRKTGFRVLGSHDGAPLCVLHSVGAKSGVPRESPMMYLADGENMVIVASIGGNPRNPGWYHNICKEPDIAFDVKGGRREMRARQASKEEADALWPRLFEMWPAWADYMERTDRVFPVMICEPR